MALDDELRDLDPVDLMDAEAARIEAHYAQLPADDWSRPSRCELWTLRDLMAHLASTEEYHRACLDGRVSKLLQELTDRGATTVAEFNAMGIEAVAGVPDQELLRAWSVADAETRRRFRERGDGEVDTSVGSYPARWQAFHLASELAIHADDAFVPVPAEDRAARDDWRARFSRFALIEAKPELSAEGMDGRTRVSGEGVDVALDDADLIEVVAGRAAGSGVDEEVQRALSTMP
jgi:uncharacterized protein (TIGR03083 family)